VTDHLLRDLAPTPDVAWKLIDAEAKERLTPNLAARRLVDWNGRQSGLVEPDAAIALTM